MTTLDISKIKRRLEAATLLSAHDIEYNGNAIVVEPTDIAALLAEVERLTETVDDCREVICEGEAVIIRLRAEIVELKALRDRITEDSIKFFTERNQARALLSTAYEDAAKVAEKCKVGVAVEVNGNSYPLGVMQMLPGPAQEATAAAIAVAIRNLATKNGAVR